jgi:hypothetical protein
VRQAAVCGGRSLLVKKLSCCNLLEVFKVQIFSNAMVYPQKKFRGTKTSLVCSRSTNEIFSEPLVRKSKTEREKNSCSQLPNSGINTPVTT